MAFALWPKRIHCPNCDYEGKARVVGTGCSLWLLFLFVVIVSFYLPPLVIIAVIMLPWLMLKPADQICPRCKFAHPVPK